MKVYAGAAIDTALGNPADQFSELMQLVQEAFGEKSVIIYNPFGAFNGNKNITDLKDIKYLIHVNEEALLASDLAVFIWSDSPSYGVPAEIEYCYQNNKAFIVWNRSSKPAGLYMKAAVMNGRGAIATTREQFLTELKLAAYPKQCAPEKEPPQSGSTIVESVSKEFVKDAPVK